MDMAVERVIPYPRQSIAQYDGVPQQRSWDCGPASTQIILAGAGIYRTEEYLIGELRTTVNGTNSAEYALPILNELLPGSGYQAVWLPKEPVSKTQVDALWKATVKSIDGNRGVLLNFEAPPINFPRGTRGSISPEYRGDNTIYHYTAGMGYAIDDDGSRHIWVADPGFRPFGYWCNLNQIAILIVPHAYATATTAEPVAAPPPVVKPEPKIDAPDRLELLWQEWNAFAVEDIDAVGSIVQRAKANDARAIRVLAKLEQSSPAVLSAFLARKV